MPHIRIHHDRRDLHERYPKESQKGGPEFGDLEIITVPGGMADGTSSAMITFTVKMKKKRRRVQLEATEKGPPH